MKKIITILGLFLFTIVTFSYGQGKKTDLQRDNIKGKVKYIKTSTDEIFKICKYNEKGNVLYYLDESLNFSSFSIYNNLGNCIEYHVFVGGFLSDKSVCTYDSKGKKIECKVYSASSGKMYINTKYKCDSKANVIEAIDYSKNGLVFEKSSFKYDNKGNKISQVFIEYDKNGNIYDKNSVERVFDDNGNSIKESIIYIEGEDELSFTNSYKYNDKADVIESVTIYDPESGGSEQTSTYEYIYDNKNNWIEKKTYVGSSESPTIIKRKIVYYGDKDENDYKEWEKKIK